MAPKPDIFRTFTGREINPLDIQVDDVVIEDVAHHLSNICRYTGASEYHFSVAQHSCLVQDLLARYNAPLHIQLAGLLHDASEAYLGDVATPLKRAPLSEGYKTLEWKVQRLIEAVFDLPYGLTECDIVKRADQEALELEWDVLIEPTGEINEPWLRRMSPEYASELFYEQYKGLEFLREGSR